MGIAEMLDELKQKAHNDSALREELLATRKEAQPYAAFCEKCRESLWLSRHGYGMVSVVAHQSCQQQHRQQPQQQKAQEIQGRQSGKGPHGGEIIRQQQAR